MLFQFYLSCVGNDNIVFRLIHTRLISANTEKIISTQKALCKLPTTLTFSKHSTKCKQTHNHTLALALFNISCQAESNMLGLLIIFSSATAMVSLAPLCNWQAFSYVTAASWQSAWA